MEFVLKIGARCKHVSMPPQLADLNQTHPGGLRFARTNAEKSDDIFSFTAMVPSMSKERLKEWCTLKPTILEEDHPLAAKMIAGKVLHPPWLLMIQDWREYP